MSIAPYSLRLARPVIDLDRSENMYRRGLGLHVLGRFDDHAGFDGVMLGAPGSSYHFEFTRSRMHVIRPTPTPEDLIVLYVPETRRWEALCADMDEAGFAQVEPFNPYWAERGRTFVDPDGYRVVLDRREWRGDERPLGSG